MNAIAPRSYKYLDLITGLFVAVLIISNVAATKIVQLGPFTFDGGTLIFPLSYIFGDVLTEVYGYARSRRVIWTGFFCVALAAATFSLVGALQPAGFWELQDAYNAILGQTPRIVIGSLVAFFAGEFSNSYVLANMKLLTEGKWLWARTIGSTLVGELVDTLLFVIIAFGGTMANNEMIDLVFSNYVFKVGIETAFTPVTYGIVSFLKKAESEDYYDRDTDFNPFALKG